MKRLITIVLIIAGAVHVHATSLQAILKQLDSYINESDTYVQEKEKRISSLREELKICSPEPSDKLYELNHALFKEYGSFKYDSAYFYANRSLKIAGQLENRDKIVQSRCALVFCYMSAGLFLEAFNEMEKVNTAGAEDATKVELYKLYNRLYYDASDFNDTDDWSLEYKRLGTAYADSIKAIVSKESIEYIFTEAQSEIKHSHFDECINLYKRLIDEYDISEHDKAIINSSIGGAYRSIGDNDSSMVYLAKAAINDIVSATKETTALYRLAEMLCERNDHDRAYTYIHTALADAEFYNARHRKLSINPLLPIIEQARIDSITSQRNKMLFIIILCVVSLVIFLVAASIVMKQNKKLKRKSQQLQEANRIKEEYIGHSFYINSEFISEAEELYKTINQKIVARQYEDLKDISKLSKVNKKRESMYESFDKCFLKIFPSFVREFATLFPEGRIDPNSTTLSSEMRIFALIRLGITDSERIAKFLNYSVHTIYTYKTRVKSKSIVSNEEFEARIKAIEIG